MSSPDAPASFPPPPQPHSGAHPVLPGKTGTGGHHSGSRESGNAPSPEATAPIAFPPTGAAFFTLPNGLEVFVKQDRTAPLVSVQTWVRTGSIHEGHLRGSGVSHLVEHMVFQGAGSRGPGELAKAVQDTGGILNAYTSFDRTVYWIDTLSSGLATAVEALADLTTRATFPETEFEKEKDVIRREIDMGRDDPGRALSQLMFSTVYREHPFREPVIGHLDRFNAVDRAAALQYYHERYQPGNMFVVIVGDTTPEAALRLVTEQFGTAGPRFAPPVPVPAEPPQAGLRRAVLPFPTGVCRMELAWTIPGLLHPDTPALEVLGVLAGSGRSSRLFREVRERRALVHGISAGAYTPPQSGLFYIAADCDPENRAEAEAAVLEVMRRLQEEEVSENEVLRARRLFLADQLGSLATMRGQATDLGGNWHAAHHPDFTSTYLAAVDRVTPDDILRVARAWLVPEHLTIVSLEPRPDSPPVDGNGKSAASTAPLPAATPEGAAHQAPQVKRHVFPNGLTLLVREDSRLPSVSLHACLRGGLLAETAETNGAGRLMARTLLKGAAGLTAEEIADRIENGGGALGAESGGSSFTVSAQVLTPELPEALRLLSAVLLQPEFPADEVERERTRQLAGLRQEEDHPSFIAFRELKRAAYGTHPLALNRNGTAASTAGLDRQALTSLHQSILTGGNAVLSVFGDCAFDTVRDAVQEVFAALPAGPRRTHADDAPVPPWKPEVLTIPSSKRQAFLVAGFPTVDLLHPDRLALDLLDEACSDMASRFFERIREQHGLAYSVGTTQVIGMAPGLFAFYLSTAPGQLEFAEQELLSEIRCLAGTGLTAEELDRARRTWSGKQAMQHQSNAGLAQQCALNELYGLGHDHDQRVLDRVRSLPLEEVNAAAARWFGSVEPLVVRVTPGE